MLDVLDQIDANLKASQVSIIEFAQSDEYCDKPLYPRQRVLLKLMFLEDLEPWEEDVLDYWIAGGRGGNEIVISPQIRERYNYLRENGYPHFREIVLVGGRRSSKGFLTGLAMAKLMFDTFQLQDPGRYYGIDPSKEIYFSCIAAAEDQAKKFQYADLVSAIEACKPLQPHLGKSLETEIGVITAEDQRKMATIKARGQRIQKRYERIRANALASNASTIRGSATMAFCIDEMAHMIPGESRASADLVYNAAEPSLDQFGADGMIFCNSSPYTKLGMFYERFEAGMELSEEGEARYPEMMVFQFPSWALFEGYQDDPERRFRNAITVSPDWDEDKKKEDGTPYYSPEDIRRIKNQRNRESQNPEKYKVERRAKFAEVVDAYLNPAVVDIMFKGRPTGEPDEWVPFATDMGEGATYNRQYVAHLDPSSTTAGFGFALGHRERLTDEQGREAEHAVFDIIKRWDPKEFPGEVIDWEAVLTEVVDYIDLFRPREVSTDQFSAGPALSTLRRKVRERGIRDGVRIYEKTATPEANWNRAETFKTALYQGFVHAPSLGANIDDLQWCELELKYLVTKNTASKWPKVDKQDIGPVQTKDMADCVMTVTESLIGNLLVNQTREALVENAIAGGAQGGFQIGGRDQAGMDSRHPSLPGYYGGRHGEQGGPMANRRVGERLSRKFPRKRTWGAGPTPRKLPGW